MWSPYSHTEKETLCELDVCRCRKNALLNCPYDIPVLSPFDNIVEARPGHIADFNFVRLSRRGRYSALSLLPYVGPMWYHRVAVEFLLHHGICAWQDITWQLHATGKRAPNTLEGPLRTIERAWVDDLHL